MTFTLLTSLTHPRNMLILNSIIAFTSYPEKHLNVTSVSCFRFLFFPAFFIIGDWKIRGMAILWFNWPFDIFFIFSPPVLLFNEIISHHIYHPAVSPGNHSSRNTQLRFPESCGLYQGDFRSIREQLPQWFMRLWGDVFLCCSGTDQRKVFL